MIKTLTVESKKENVVAVTEFVENLLESIDCPIRNIMQISVAIDELYSNVSKYAYGESTGVVEVEVESIDEPKGVSITLRDEGIKYNPLENEDPDISLSAEEREIGGLGILVVKKTMDDLLYKFENGKNCVTIIKYFS